MTSCLLKYKSNHVVEAIFFPSDCPDPGSRHTRALKSIGKGFEDCIIGKAHIAVLSSSTTQRLSLGKAAEKSGSGLLVSGV